MKFYVLENNQFVGPFAFGEMVEPVNIGESGSKCPRCGTFLMERPWEPPYRVRFQPGTQSRSPGDIVFGDYADFIASRRFRDLWRERNLYGVEAWHPVAVVGGAGEFFRPSLMEPIVQADLEATQIDWMRRPECELCGSGVMNSLRGLAILEDTWSGQDIFRLMNISGLLVTSQRFAEMVVSSGITNAHLIPLEEYKEDLLQ